MNILITGAGSGIAKEASLLLAKKGHTVYATTHTAARAKQFDHPNITAFKLDITKEKDRKKVLEYEIDVLVNNAALGESGPLSEIPIERVRNIFETNVFSTLELTQLVLTKMIPQKSGKIVFVGSIAGELPVPFLAPYTMTKTAVQFMYASIKEETKNHGITVALLEPGPYATGFNESMVASKWEWFSKDNLLWSERERIRKNEQRLLSKQFDVSGAANALVRAIEGSSRIYTAPRWLKSVLGFIRLSSR